MHIDQRIEQGNPEKRKQDGAAEAEKRVRSKEEAVNGVENEQRQVYLQEVEEEGIHGSDYFSVFCCSIMLIMSFRSSAEIFSSRAKNETSSL